MSRAGPIHTWRPRACQFILTSSSSPPWLSLSSCTKWLPGSTLQLLHSASNSREKKATREKRIEELIGLFSRPAFRQMSAAEQQNRLPKLIFSQLNVGNVEFAVSLEEDSPEPRRPNTRGDKSRTRTAKQTTLFNVRRWNEMKHSCRNSRGLPMLHCTFVRLQQTELASEPFTPNEFVGPFQPQMCSSQQVGGFFSLPLN